MTSKHEMPILEARNISKIFGKFQALKDVSTRFMPGTLTAIIGPNGAGKSTFFNVLSGAFPPSSGEILFNGKNITGLAQHEFARIGISKSFQITNVFKQLTVHENVRVAAQMETSRYNFLTNAKHYPRPIELADQLLKRVNLEHIRNKKTGDLAHGQQRALEIAMALACNPSLLLLDEPTAGMSPEETLVMMELIRTLATERTVILVEHKMKLIMGLCERIIVLHHGEFLAEGTPADIQNNAEVRRVYLGQG
jgi:branched-chain amino acid transport system ATP-binding protein